MTQRSSDPLVRNPVLALPSATAIGELPPEVRESLANLLLALAADASGRADACWKKRKAPMAAYWRAVSVYARHIARALRPRRSPPTRFPL